ncbi:substrate-binding domain-containing protein [Marinovum algicola]|uniref:substrate-binding domain-containing protein n=2 Tax=Roseobacteraceae TaxID=2854170 RepID=UPI0024B9D8BE|nr:substrate-binding domain-containing protein [Marinovum algicola]
MTGDADAWITWPNRPITKDGLDMIELAEDRVVYRDINVVLSSDADPEAKAFLDFLVTEEAREILATEGWQR